MELELVEIVIEVEQTFGIRLPAGNADDRTVGQLHDCIAKALVGEAGSGGSWSLRVRQAVPRRWNRCGELSPQQIRPEYAVARDNPDWGRRRTWRRLGGATALGTCRRFGGRGSSAGSDGYRRCPGMAMYVWPEPIQNG